ncbi:STAS domain-containing protein [Actinomadura flavalba]|uniref:STAS domain-containing protein n=1 Tax=Actinomadura flavalba TaxID=1120938 RepID=UPI0003817BCB|nr:STAS domain-containing protein [Actinomadura flavalba]
MDFDLALVRHESCTVVLVRGELDLVSRERFEASLLDALDAGRPLVVDMRDVTFCDSTGLNAVIVANRRATERAVPLALISLTPRVRRVFHITAVDQYIPVHETLADAIGTFAPTAS